MVDCLFCKIRDKKIPAAFVYEDNDVMVFPDIRPIKRVHLLIVPKKHGDARGRLVGRHARIGIDVRPRQRMQRKRKQREYGCDQDEVGQQR